MNWWKASIATATAQIVRMAGGLLVIKLLAIYLGPTGFGRLGHFMSLIAILSVLSGGGVLNGIIKYVAEYQNNPHKLSKFLTTALLYSLFFSIIIFVLIFVFSKTISYKLFNDEKFYPTIILLSLIQLSYGLVNFCNGIVNGFRATGKYAVIIIYGTFIGVPLAYYFISNYSFEGAVVGLALINASMLLPSLWQVYKLGILKLIKFTIDSCYVIKLFQFSIMQFFSLITLPIAEIYIRNAIIQNTGWNEAGLWQSLMRLSSVYFAIFAAYLTAYYLPTLSLINDAKKTLYYVIKYVIGIGTCFLLIATIIYLFKDFFIFTIFSKEFYISDENLKFQLIGDLFKLMAYTIAFLLIARAKTVFYIFFEFLQAALYLGITMLLIDKTNILTVFIAYAISNFMYFLICLVGLFRINFRVSK